MARRRERVGLGVDDVAEALHQLQAVALVLDKVVDVARRHAGAVQQRCHVHDHSAEGLDERRDGRQQLRAEAVWGRGRPAWQCGRAGSP
eukprot:365320-Chlamydomonas_euryale.AAC.6